MIISGTFKIETADDGTLTIESVSMTVTALGATEASVSQRGMGETEGTAHKALQDVLSNFRQVNNLRAGEMSREYMTGMAVR